MQKHKITLVDVEGGITTDPTTYKVKNGDHVSWDTSQLEHKQVYLKFQGTSPANGTFYLDEHGHLSLAMNNSAVSYPYQVSYSLPGDSGIQGNPTPPPPPVIIILDDSPS